MNYFVMPAVLRMNVFIIIVVLCVHICSSILACCIIQQLSPGKLNTSHQNSGHKLQYISIQCTYIYVQFYTLASLDELTFHRCLGSGSFCLDPDRISFPRPDPDRPKIGRIRGLKSGSGSAKKPGSGSETLFFTFLLQNMYIQYCIFGLYCTVQYILNMIQKYKL